MAEIIGRLALSHGPQLIMPPERWQDLPHRLDLEPDVRPELESDISEEVKSSRFQRCMDAMAYQRRILDAWNPDAIVLIGDDQHENIQDDNQPPFLIYINDEVDATLHFHYKGAEELNSVTKHQVDAPLAQGILESLMDNGFDPAWSKKTRMESGLGHAFGRPLHFLDPDSKYPIVPVMVNTFFPPAPSAKRSLALGEAIGKAIEEFDGAERVAVIGSGGLSHFVIDEEVDNRFMTAVAERDFAYMGSMPGSLLVGGTSELRNWMATAATTEKPGKMIDYLPCYRTMTGIGCSMGFAIWE